MKKNTDTFVWTVSHQSKDDYIELKYSIKSVKKFHPQSNIVLVGGKPDWYEGNFIFVEDMSDCRFTNTWNCIIQACKLYDNFVQMDDDFFLLKKYEPKFYIRDIKFIEEIKKTILTMKNDEFHFLEKDIESIIKQIDHEWLNHLYFTYSLLKSKNNKNNIEDYYNLHCPLPIISKNFLKIIEQYPEYKRSPSLIRYQIYCPNEENIPVELVEYDFKILENETSIEELLDYGFPFFSTHKWHDYYFDFFNSFYGND